MEATQKPKRVEFKTGDKTVQRRKANGEKADISNKCMDFQQEMISVLGVSKPILENVIFCHQVSIKSS